MSESHIIAQIERAIQEDNLELNDWESEFIEAIKIRLQLGNELSEKQDACLMKIFNKIK